MSELKIVSRSQALPISLAAIKEHLPIDGTDHDSRLQDLIWAAVASIEADSDVVFIDTTYDELLPKFPTRRLPLSKGPVRSVTSISYYDTANQLQTVADYYLINPTRMPAYIEPHALYWPNTYADRPDAVTVRYVCGWSASFRPRQFEQLIRLLVGAWNENREAEIVGSITTEIKLGYDRLIAQLKFGRYC